MGGSQGEDWGAMLDRLSNCITPNEEVATRQASVDRGSPTYLRDLHNHVGRLLVKYGITTWHHLRRTFPGRQFLRRCGSSLDLRQETDSYVGYHTVC